MSKAAAKRIIDDYIHKMATEHLVSPWKHVRRDDFGRELKARVDDPRLISSRVVNLCGPAAFFHNLASDKPEMYAQIGIDLYGPNVAELGSRKFWASRDLMNAPLPRGMDSADWVVLASLRDHENSALDYDDSSGTLSGLTMPSALEDWFEQAGYGSIQDESNVWFTKSQDNIEAASNLVATGNRICLLIHSQMLNTVTQGQWSMFPNHWIVLKKAAHGSAVSIRGGNISFRAHSWGSVISVPSAGSLSVSDFTDNYYGYVSAKPR